MNKFMLQNPDEQYHHQYNLVYSTKYHVIFTPKYRRKVLVDGVDEYLKQLILEKQNEYDYQVIQMEVMPDHVHLLLDLNPKSAPYAIVKKIKGYTSRAIRDKFPELDRKLPTLWTRSSFIASVGAVSLETVKRYIENQKGV